MSDAPETIWARPDPYEPDWTDDKDLTTKWHTKYRRASLPATDAQALANPKVQALVEALERIAHLRATDPMDDPRVRALYGLVHDALTSGFLENNSWADDASAALAAMEADDE